MTQTAQAFDNTGKGKAFFDRADQVAEARNWDFAIQMYLEGIRREPGNVQRGHKPLRDVSLKRKTQGGKPLGFMEAMKLRGGKEPTDALVHAEHLLAKEPGNVNHMVAVLKALEKLNQPAAVKWIADIIFEAMRLAKRASKSVMVMLVQSYFQIEEYATALQACDFALRLDPDDAQLQDMARNLSARDTIKQGQYDTAKVFTTSVKNLDRQIELTQKDHLVQSRQVLEADIERTRREYEASPTVAGKVDALVDALLKVPEEGYENQAIDVLDKAHADSKAYRFRMRLDDIKIRQLRRRYNKILAEAGKEAGLGFYAKEVLPFELAVFTERARNYPTDLAVKFELGRRQFLAGHNDDAIASLQQAQRDARHRITAMSLLGQAFAKKNWHREAAETYARALESDPSEDRRKELHYNLAVSCKALGDKQKALDNFSAVAQMDYNYRDVRHQIDVLRKEMGQ